MCVKFNFLVQITLKYFQGTCFHSLLNDFIKNGICDNPFNPDFNPFDWPVDSCIWETINGYPYITEGLCSNQTEYLITLRRECAFAWARERTLIFNSISLVLGKMCQTESVDQLFAEISTGSSISRLIPVEAVIEYFDATIYTKLNLGNMIVNFNYACIIYFNY